MDWRAGCVKRQLEAKAFDLMCLLTGGRMKVERAYDETQIIPIKWVVNVVMK